MDVKRYQELAEHIMEMCVGYEPAEYESALTLATAIYFKAQFPHDLEGTFKQHVENLRLITEELDAKDVLDIKGITL